MTTYLASAMQLRFVIREVTEPVPNNPPFTNTYTQKILQYGLRPVNERTVEWFDVPCYDERNVT